jgi:hypothetical protein
MTIMEVLLCAVSQVTLDYYPSLPSLYILMSDIMLDFMNVIDMSVMVMTTPADSAEPAEPAEPSGVTTTITTMVEKEGVRAEKGGTTT